MEMFAMGKYGAYVWSCFGLTFTVIAVCIWQARHRHRKVSREILRRADLLEPDV